MRSGFTFVCFPSAQWCVSPLLEQRGYDITARVLFSYQDSTSVLKSSPLPGWLPTRTQALGAWTPDGRRDWDGLGAAQRRVLRSLLPPLPGQCPCAPTHPSHAYQVAPKGFTVPFLTFPSFLKTRAFAPCPPVCLQCSPCALPRRFLGLCCV